MRDGPMRHRQSPRVRLAALAAHTYYMHRLFFFLGPSFGELIMRALHLCVSADMSPLLAGAVTGTAPDATIDIPDEHQLSILQTRDDYLTDRARAMQNIEATMEEIGGIFQQLATMVAEQGETVERIDREVDNTVSDFAHTFVNSLCVSLGVYPRFLSCVSCLTSGGQLPQQMHNVEGAHKELTKYFESVSSNRGMMLKILGVLLAFLVFFLVVVA